MDKTKKRFLFWSGLVLSLGLLGWLGYRTGIFVELMGIWGAGVVAGGIATFTGSSSRAQRKRDETASELVGEREDISREVEAIQQRAERRSQSDAESAQAVEPESAEVGSTLRRAITRARENEN